MAKKELNTKQTRKEAIIKKIEELTTFPFSEDDYEPRIVNMLKIVCQGKYKAEDIVTMSDTSISSTGRSGIVLTTEAICVKDAGNSTSKFIAKYEDIDFVYFKEDRFLGVDISNIELHMKYGVTYKLSTTVEGLSIKRMYKLMDFLVDLCKIDDSLEW